MIVKGKNYRYGIHVPDNKSLSKDKEIEVFPSPKMVYVSLTQHIGAPAQAVVNVGDKVKKGMLIGKETGFVSANVYSPISGEVKSIERITNGLQQNQEYVVIENDNLNEEEFLSPLTTFSKEEIVARIREAGIVGLGGAGFPTAVKFSPKEPIDTLIINGAECEPYLTCDYRLMLERADDIYKGIKYLKIALGVSNVIVGIEKNKPDVIEKFGKLFPDLKIVALKKQYPMGSEKHLIYCTTGRKVPVGKLPMDVSVCVANIKTVIACLEAVEDNKPLTEIVLTVSGNGIVEPKNLLVPLGTSFSEIIEFCGGLTEKAEKIIAGGPMMGKTLINLNHFARKTDSGITVLTKDETDIANPTNCINCAKCASNCPMRLMPMYIEAFALAGDFESAEKYGAMNCLECGSCAYNCPAKRSLVQSINYAKSKIRELKTNG